MHEKPTPTPGTPADVRRDAVVRAVRTFGQSTIGGSAAALIILVAATTLDVMSTGEAVTVAMLVQAILASLGAWLLRRWEARRR